MSEVKEPQKKSRKRASILFIPVGLLIGMGIGFAANSPLSYMITGLGAGMLIYALVMILVRD